MDTDATIIAVASPPGRSLRGIVRITGPETFNLLRAVLRLRSLDKSPGSEHTLPDAPKRIIYAGRLSLHDDHDAELPILVLIFPGPASYTGEDSAELQLPGNPDVLERVLRRLIDAGHTNGLEARRAEPGEFTARAYFHGKLSLTEAEGVAATIAARSDAELRAGQTLTAGRLGRLAHELADDLANTLALVEAGIDFTDEEDVVPISPDDLHARLRNLIERIETQRSRSVGMESLQAVPWVVLTGPPNAGKSTLFNALLGRDRAVVSQIAGTTRDVLAEPLRIDTPAGPAEVMLADGAGVDAAGDALNRRMQAQAREALDRAELVLACQPVAEADDNDDGHERAGDESAPGGHARTGHAAVLTVRTKADLVAGSDQTADRRIDDQRDDDVVTVSARTGRGLESLGALIAERLADRAVSLAGDALALQPRHDDALRAAGEHLQAAAALVEPMRSERDLTDPELVAASMRAGLDALAALAGDITPDDVLGRVFASFCVGK